MNKEGHPGRPNSPSPNTPADNHRHLTRCHTVHAPSTRPLRHGAQDIPLNTKPPSNPDRGRTRTSGPHIPHAGTSACIPLRAWQRPRHLCPSRPRQRAQQCTPCQGKTLPPGSSGAEIQSVCMSFVSIPVHVGILTCALSDRQSSSVSTVSVHVGILRCALIGLREGGHGNLYPHAGRAARKTLETHVKHAWTRWQEPSLCY